jgi:hypothetical protein
MPKIQTNIFEKAYEKPCLRNSTKTLHFSDTIPSGIMTTLMFLAYAVYTVLYCILFSKRNYLLQC